ncbi:MAG: hypothetical protein BWX80_01386 [Candidatus Hydrogenedentes bacterium ADurb.Bin101]|nr:MAG: hypothetical protein BWX80_01386 [Candidatus Hydrogenedentes bacterium ADurb.Bin101]
MFGQPEYEHIVFFGVVITPNSLENSRTIIKRVGHHADFRLFNRHIGALKIGNGPRIHYSHENISIQVIVDVLAGRISDGR